MAKYKHKKGLSKEKAKTMLRDNQAQGHKLTSKQKKYFGYIAGGGKPTAQAGLINSDMPQQTAQPQPQPQPQGGMPQPQLQGQPQGQPNQPQGKSIDVSLTMNSGDGQPQPLGNISIKSPDDVKKLIQMIVQAMGQSQPQGQEGQPQQ